MGYCFRDKGHCLRDKGVLFLIQWVNVLLQWIDECLQWLMIAMRTALYKQAAWFVNRGGDVERLGGGVGGLRRSYSPPPVKEWAGVGRRLFI